jgi:PilZ domain
MPTATRPEASTAVPASPAPRPTGVLPVTTIYAAQKEDATIVCAQCGTTKDIKVANFAALPAPLKVCCPCGYRFALKIEGRRLYRKPVRLVGEYVRGAYRARMAVDDVSRGGVGFRTEHPQTLQVGEQIIVHFRLDDPQRSEVSALVVIRRIEGLRVGAAFVDVGAYTATNRLLGFYLMA